MGRRRRRKGQRSYSRLFSWLGGLLVLALAVHYGWDIPLPGSPAPEKKSGPAAKVFEVLYGAKLVADRNNDGDSFKISHKGKIHVLRLYFVDSPEKQPDRYNGTRLIEQGQYFGGLSEGRTMALGQQAQAFTHRWLTERPFTVYTKWHGVFDSGRHYAFVVFPDGEDLSAKLVREGLARIHTLGATLPDGRSTELYTKELRALEEESRAARRGGWGG